MIFVASCSKCKTRFNTDDKKEIPKKCPRCKSEVETRKIGLKWPAEYQNGGTKS